MRNIYEIINLMAFIAPKFYKVKFLAKQNFNENIDCVSIESYIPNLMVHVMVFFEFHEVFLLLNPIIFDININ